MMNKRITVALITFALMVTFLPVNVLAGGGTNSQNNPYTDTTDGQNFPQYPNPGSVKIDKTAAWVEGSDGYAKVTMDIKSIPPTSGADLIVILDTSSSMDSFASTCINPDHYTEFEISKEISYMAYTPSNGIQQFRDKEVTLHGRAHTDDSGMQVIERFSISGMETSYAGEPITQYQIGSLKLETKYMNINDPYFRIFFAEIFENETVIVNNQTITLPSKNQSWKFYNDRHYGDAPAGQQYNTDSRDNGCFFRIDVAQDALTDMIDVMFQNKDGVSGNRISIVTFNEQAELLGSKDFYNSNVNDVTELKTLVNGITIMDNCGTSYGCALIKAKEIIDNRPSSEQTRPAVVLFISDGAPDYVTSSNPAELEQDAAKAIADIKPTIDAMYSIGIALTTDDERKAINTVVKEPGINKNVTDDPSLLKSIFMEIAQLAKDVANISVITDTIGPAFDLIPNSEQFPWVVTAKSSSDDDKEVSTNSMSTKAITTKSMTAQGNKMTWNLGYLPQNSTLSYFIQVKNGTSKGMYPTSTIAHLTYINHLNNWAQLEFPVPMLEVKNDIPGGSGGNNGGGGGTESATTETIGTTEDIDDTEEEFLEPDMEDNERDDFVDPATKPTPTIPKANIPKKSAPKTPFTKYPKTGDANKYISISLTFAAFSAIILVGRRKTKKQQ